MQGVEQRWIDFRALSPTDNEMNIEGYAIIYEEPATHKCGNRNFTEIIKRGALEGAEIENVPLRYNHNDTYCIMASTKNGSLQILQEDRGLKFQANLIDTQSNRDIFKAIQNGLLDKMSFAFSVEKGGDTWEEQGLEIIRTVHKIKKLYDISVVDIPFYDTTSVYIRSMELMEEEWKRDFLLKKRKLYWKYKNKN